ncbi:MAG: hypothetical protein NVSMB9_02790 [Isosphaeraceae bacterium]
MRIVRIDRKVLEMWRVAEGVMRVGSKQRPARNLLTTRILFSTTTTNQREVATVNTFQKISNINIQKILRLK